jgi:hypothetical protein
MILREPGCTCPDISDVCRAELEGVDLVTNPCRLHDPEAVVATARREAGVIRARAVYDEARAELGSAAGPTNDEPEDVRSLVSRALRSSVDAEPPAAGAPAPGTAEFDAEVARRWGGGSLTPPRDDPLNDWPPSAA